VARRDLDGSGTELALDRVVGNDRNRAIEEGQHALLADEVAVALVVGMHTDPRVPHHRLGPRGGDGDEAPLFTFHGVAHVPELALGGLHLHFVVGDGRAEHAVPVDESRTAVDQSLLPEPHEGLAHRARHLRSEREARARPVA